MKSRQKLDWQGIGQVGLIFSVLLISACGSTEDNRWGTVAGLSDQSVQPDFVVSSTAIPQGGDLTFSDLPDSVAAAYIGAAAKVATTPAQLLQLLRMPIRSAGSSDDATAFQRMLVLNVFEKGYHPGDSIIQTRLTIVPKDFVFTNLEAAKTEYSTIEVDKISTSNGISTTAELEASPPIPVGTASVSITGSHSTEKSADISVRVQDLSVNLENGNLVVFREGGRGRDLTGNTIVKLTIADASPSSDGRERVKMMVADLDVGSPGHWKSPTSASVDIQRRRGLYATGMVAEARLNYVLRHVSGGAKTYAEGDDAVRFESGCVAKQVVVVPASETALHTWIVSTGSGAVLIDTDAGQRDMTFADYQTARRFVSWLQATRADSIGGLRVRIYPVGDTLDGTIPLGQRRSALQVVPTTGRIGSSLAGNSRLHPCDMPDG